VTQKAFCDIGPSPPGRDQHLQDAIGVPPNGLAADMARPSVNTLAKTSAPPLEHN